MRAFFGYYGAKRQLARYYGAPRRDIVVEPFAGSAGYSTYWDVERAILVEIDPTIYGVWQWLIEEATYDSIMELDHTLTTTRNCSYDQRIKDFIGLWFFKGNYRPTESMSPKIIKINEEKQHLWCMKTKIMIAEQIHKIKKWQIILGSYDKAPHGDYHYHIDPPYAYSPTSPYNTGGRRYKYDSKRINYEELAEWCLTKQCGDVCDAGESDWLPFEEFRTARQQKSGHYKELIYRLDKNPINNRLFT